MSDAKKVPMFVSGLSGNEIFCLKQKGFTPAELTVGNCVNSMGIAGGISMLGRAVAGGEIQALTAQISDGRHLAITRMEEEARKHGAAGVTGVEAELRTLAGYQEFLAQGTAVHCDQPMPFFSSAASGIELYCHLDAGYRPVKFAMGNIAYSLGIGRGLTGGLRTLARGEVKEYSQMYNEIRHTAVMRLRKEALEAGANAVVDAHVQVIPHGTAVELLVTGTASHHPALGAPKGFAHVVTSELQGEELWNLAALDLVPLQLVMSTSVYSLGVVGGISSMFKAMSAGELPEVTKLVYEARENCLDLLRREAEQFGAVQVIGNKLTIIELQPGLIEVFALGTAVQRRSDMKPAAPALIPQAVITEGSTLDIRPGGPGSAPQLQHGGGQQPMPQGSPICGCIIGIGMMLFFILMGIIAAIAGK